MLSGYVTAAGTKLYYERAGQGPTCVLVHGMSLDRRTFEAQWAPFQEHFDLVRYDMRGFGRSELPGGEAYAHRRDLAALLDALGVEHAHLVGHSMGGQVALDFSIDYPDRVRRLVLACSDLTGHRFTGQMVQVFSEVRQAMEADGIEAAKEVWYNCLISEDMSPAVAEQLREMLRDWSGWQFTNPGSALLPEPPTVERLSEMGKPCLVVSGTLDIDDLRAAAAILGERLPRGALRIIDGAGHMLNMTHPELFNRLVLDFLLEETVSH